MIDVVIPVYNSVNMVQQCMDAIYAQKRVNSIIIINDASTDTDLLDYLDNVKATVLHNGRNLGFIHSVNKGMRLVQTEYAVIVNSDVVPLLNDALLKLVTAMDSVKANVCGAKLLFMPGSKFGKPWTIQHAGVGFDPDGKPYHPFMHLHRDTKAANVPKFVHAVTGAVMGIRMSKWRELGGFDERYAPGVFEDVDYCLRAKKVVYEPLSEWLHLMHGSQTEGVNLFDYHDDNLKLLLDRWQMESDESLYYGGA